MLSQRAVRDRALTWWILALFLVYFLDSLGDTLIDSSMLLLLGQPLGANNVLSALVMGMSDVVGVVFLLLGSQIMSSVPRESPMGLLATVRLVTVPAILAILVLAYVAAMGHVSYLLFFAVTLLYVLLFTGGEILGSMAVILTIKRYTHGFGAVPQVLYTFAYGTFNLAALASGLINAGIRRLQKGDLVLSNWTVVCVGVALTGATMITASLLHRGLASRRLVKKAQALTSSWDLIPPVRSWAAVILHDYDFHTFLIITLCMTGVKTAFSHVVNTLPKYMIRHFGERELYPLFAAINAFIAAILVFVQPCLPIPRGRPAYWLMAGTSVQAAASAWAPLFPETKWAIVAYMVQFTLGEAFGMPLLNMYLMEIAPRGKETMYTALSRGLCVLLPFAVTLSSGVLLEYYCPNDITYCDQTIWWWVTGTAAITPISLFFCRVVWGRIP